MLGAEPAAVLSGKFNLHGGAVYGGGVLGQAYRFCKMHEEAQ